VGGGELVLSGDEVRLVFLEEKTPEPVPLFGTTWGLDSLALATDAVASPVAGTDVTLELLEDGSATGSGGCNTFNTTYVVDGCIDPIRPGREHERCRRGFRTISTPRRPRRIRSSGYSPMFPATASFSKIRSTLASSGAPGARLSIEVRSSTHVDPSSVAPSPTDDPPPLPHAMNTDAEHPEDGCASHDGEQ
jgi:META domain